MVLYPALKISGRVITGKRSDSHNSLGATVGIANPTENSRGFSPDGVMFLSRTQALGFLKSHDRKVYNNLPLEAQKGLHSEHLATAYGIEQDHSEANTRKGADRGEHKPKRDSDEKAPIEEKPVKKLSELKALVYDRGGLYLYCAEKLAETLKEVKYYLADADAYPTSQKSNLGVLEGKLKRVHDFFKHIDEVDVIYFFDCYDGELQHWLRGKGYTVFGSGRGEQIEIDKILFLETLEELGLPCPKTYVAEGMDDLCAYLKKNDGETLFLKNLHRGDFECFDEETKILTNSGWKYFKDVSVGEPVLTRDMASGIAAYAPIDNVFAEYYSGEMYRIQNARVDLLVTPDHKFFHWTQARNKVWKYDSIKNIIQGGKSGGTSFKIPRNFTWQAERVETKTIRNTYPDKVKPRFGGEDYAFDMDAWLVLCGFGGEDYAFDMDAWLVFCGWFASEGCLNLNKSPDPKYVKYRVIVSQDKFKNPEKYALVEESVKSLGINYQREGTIGFSIYNKPLWDELRNFYITDVCVACGKPHCAHIKQVPQYIKELPPEQIRLFLESFLMGDGYISRTISGNEARYGSSSHKLVSDIQELLYKCNRTGSMHTRARKGNTREYKGKLFNYLTDEYYVSEGTTSDVTITNRMVKRVQYEGLVFDVEVKPHHSIFVMRNDKCCWTGNSRKFNSMAQSRPFLNDLKKRLGSASDTIEVLVQHKIDSDIEVGYDGFCIDGQFTDNCIVGYEIKDKGFVGKVFKEPPPIIKGVNDAFSPVLKKLGGRGNYSTEIRVTKAGEPYYIDPTQRVPSPPGELMCEIYENWAEATYQIACGEVPILKEKAKYGAEYILTSEWHNEHELHVKFPKKYKQHVKLKNHSIREGEYYCVPNGNGAFFGAVVAWADTLDAAIEKVSEVAESIEADEYCYDCSVFDEAKAAIKAGIKHGIQF